MSELPKGWVEAELGEVAEVRLGRQRSPDKHTGLHPRPYLRAANVTWDGLDLSDVNQMDFTEEEVETYGLRPGDVLLNEASGSPKEVGKAALYRGEIADCCFQNTLIRVRSGEAMVPEFICQRLLNDARAGRFVEHGRGIGINHLGSAKMQTWPVQLPPMAEQRRIVAKLDDLLARSKRAKEELAAIPALLERYRQSVLAAAFRGDLTADWRAKNPEVEPASELLKRIRLERRRRWEEAELARLTAKGKAPTDEKWKGKYEEPVAPVDIPLPLTPDTWGWTSLEALIDPTRPLCYGVVQPGDSVIDGTPLVRVMDLADGSVLVDQLRTVSRNVDAEYSRSRLVGGEVLISVVGTIGRLAIAPESLKGSNIARAVARAATAKGLHARWLLAWLSTPFMQDWLSRAAVEVARQTLNLGTLAAAPVPVASDDEMTAVLGQIDRSTAVVQSPSREVEALGSQCDELDRTVLTRAFRGELVPQDPADEPASVLLDRIRAERAAAPAKKPGRKPRQTNP